MRTALDAGNPKAAIEELNELLDVKSEKELPKDIKGDPALFVLDRGSIQQSMTHWDLSKQDFEAADKAASALQVSRFTIYNYLEVLKHKSVDAELLPPRLGRRDSSK